MTTGRYLLFALFAFISFCVLSAVQYRMRKRSGIALRILSAVIKFLAATATAYSIISTDSWMAWNAGLFFAALYAVLLGDAASDILCLICLEKTKRIDSRASQMIIGAVCTLALLLYGTVNMQVVSPNYFTVGSEKLSQSYKAVFLADLHVGSSQSMATTEKTIRKAAAESPDIVILGGDITDEFTTKEEMERTFELLGELEVPMYYIYGNHDRQPNHEKAIGRTYSDEELRSALDANGIIVLEDEWVAFSDDLILMGRDDVSTGVDRIDITAIPPRPADSFVLLLDHSPYSVADTEASDADLQLSGHTHAGQLFPLQFMYNLTGYDAYGFYRHGKTDVYVSAGASGWYFPFRTEAHCQFDVITLQGKS